MGKQTFFYFDSEAGLQGQRFSLLSELIKHIEDFGWHGDSEGVIYANDTVILNYVSTKSGITWG